jgi:hypothetical protein
MRTQNTEHTHQTNQINILTMASHMSGGFHGREHGSNLLDIIFAGWCKDRDLKHIRDDVYQEAQQERREHSLKHPLVTLFFDDQKKLSIAVLSSQHANVALDNYFQSRLESGTAYQRSPLYFLLDGYLRENLTRIKQQTGCDSISFAMGALEASDTVQRQELEQEVERKSDLIKRQESAGADLLERVLEIARFNRLNDDLDVLDIYCLRNTSKGFARMAANIAKHRMFSSQFVLTPSVDGVSITGFSNFVRHGDGTLVRYTESGRIIEYQQCQDIELGRSPQEDYFVPTEKDPSRTDEFTWECEEIALANMGDWWGDLAVREYVGQKLSLSWKPAPADATYGVEPVWLSCLRLDNGSAFKGEHEFSLSHQAAKITLRVLESRTMSLDDATTSYTGRIKVVKVEIDYLSLVRAAARALLPRLRERHTTIQQTRPLMQSELEYLETVEHLLIAER